MLKVPKRSFVVVVLLLGVISSSKNVTKVTKHFREQKMLHREQKMFAYKIWSKSNKKGYKGNRKCSGLVRLIVVLYRVFMVFCSMFMVFLVFYGLSWSFIVIHGLSSGLS